MPFRDFINLTHAYAWYQAKLVSKIPDEPGLISAFIAEPMLKELEAIICSHLNLSNSKVILNGIFTHKTPTVKPCGATNSVEIADMLFVRQHFSLDPKKSPEGKAFLIQAKRNTIVNSGNVSAGNPKIQFDLYKSWPKFEGTSRISPNAPDGSNWNFNSVSNNNPGLYVAVFNGHIFNPSIPPNLSPVWSGAPVAVNNSQFSKFPENTSWGYGAISATTLPNEGVNCTNSFADLLRDFVEGKAGVSFTPGGANNDHWSAFVNEMLSVAALGDYTYLSRRTGINNPLLRNGSVQAHSAVLPVLGFISQRFRTPNIFLSGKDNFYFRHWLKNENYIITRDLCRWAYEASRYDDIPPHNIENSPPPDEPGHPPIVSLVTFGEK